MEKNFGARMDESGVFYKRVFYAYHRCTRRECHHFAPVIDQRHDNALVDRFADATYLMHDGEAKKI